MQKVTIKKVKTFEASLFIGLELGYTKQSIRKEDVVNKLKAFQDGLIRQKGVYLSASITDCNIVLSGQNEKHLKISFINYPKFAIKRKLFKKEVINLASYLMNAFKQNRVVIMFTDETIMLENNNKIDSRIKKETKEE